MKKFLYFALMAMLAMPLMVSCEKEYDPRDPKSKFDSEDPRSHSGSQEWFDNWTKGNKEDALVITAENLIGNWDLIIFTMKANDSLVPINAYVYEEGSSDHEYMELQQSKEYVMHRMDNGTQIVTKGKWEVQNNKLIFSNDRGEVAIPRSNGEELKIIVLEEDRLVLKCAYNQMGDNNDDELYCYFVYKRIGSIPELPKPTVEHLIASSWKVLSDTITYYEVHGHYNSEHVFIEDTDANGHTQEKITEQKINTYKDAVIRFYEDGAFRIKDASGKTLGEAQWELQQDLGNGWILLSFHEIDDEGYYHNIDILGFSSGITFHYDAALAPKAVMDGYESFAIENDTKKYMKSIFHIEAQ